MPDGAGRPARVWSEVGASWRAFVRRRTAVFFTFFFPVIIIGIFGALVETSAAGLFSQPQSYYLPGYLAVVVLLTPLSRVGSTVARHRSFNRFEKLATTPLTRYEWLAAHTLVNAAFIGAASLVIVVVMLFLGGGFVVSPWIAVYVFLGVAAFCGLGAVLGRLAGSQDGVVALSNAVGIPMLFLAETFVSPDMLPESVRPLVDFLPLTYFSRGVRSATLPPTDGGYVDLLVLAAVAVAFFLLGGYLIPWRE